MSEVDKLRPLRLFDYGGKVYYMIGNGRHKLIGRKTKKFAELQKSLLKKLSARFKPRDIIESSERIAYKPKLSEIGNVNLIPLQFNTEIPKASDEDEGLKLVKSKESHESKLERLRLKIRNNEALTDQEKTDFYYLEKEASAASIVEAKFLEKIKLEKQSNEELLDKIATEKELKDLTTTELKRRAKIKITTLLPDEKIPDELFTNLAVNDTESYRGLLNLVGYIANDDVNGIKRKFESPFRKKVGRKYEYNNYEWPEYKSIQEAKTKDEIINIILRTYTLDAFDEFKKYRNIVIQRGTGKLPALYNDEINDYFADESKYPNFAGVISSDQIDELPKKLPMGFIMNLDTSDGKGTHWVAVYINGSSLEYFDPLGDPPTEDFLNRMKQFLVDMKVPVMLKLKINKVKWQNDTSVHCGYFAIQWLDNRFHGVPFKSSTRFVDKSGDGEKQIKKEFDYI